MYICSNQQDDVYPEDGYDSDPPATAVPPAMSLSESQVSLHQHGGGLGTPTGAKTNISGFSELSDKIQSVMNKDGLGWPGTFTVQEINLLAKSTLNRLRQTPEEAAKNEERLAGAVKTILECLGEDPERDGLRDTPKRYARALLWMTRGYEEQLCGMYTVVGPCLHARCDLQCDFRRGPRRNGDCARYSRVQSL